MHLGHQLCHVCILAKLTTKKGWRLIIQPDVHNYLCDKNIQRGNVVITRQNYIWLVPGVTQALARCRQAVWKIGSDLHAENVESSLVVEIIWTYLSSSLCLLIAQGWGLLSQFSLFLYFPKISALSKHTLAIEYHLPNMNVIQIILQVSLWDRKCLLTEKLTNGTLVTPTLGSTLPLWARWWP